MSINLVLYDYLKKEQQIKNKSQQLINTEKLFVNQVIVTNIQQVLPFVIMHSYGNSNGGPEIQ